MLRQSLISLLVLVVAAALYVFLVPGSTETLSRFGIQLPLPAAEPSPPKAAARAVVRAQGSARAVPVVAVGRWSSSPRRW